MAMPRICPLHERTCISIALRNPRPCSLGLDRKPQLDVASSRRSDQTPCHSVQSDWPVRGRSAQVRILNWATIPLLSFEPYLESLRHVRGGERLRSSAQGCARRPNRTANSTGRLPRLLRRSQSRSFLRTYRYTGRSRLHPAARGYCRGAAQSAPIAPECRPKFRTYSDHASPQ